MLPHQDITRSLVRIFDGVADRWTLWRLVRWCERLSRADRFEFDALISQMPAGRTFNWKTVQDVDLLPDSSQQQEHLQIAVAGLTPAERTLLRLSLEGVTCHEMSARLHANDERVRQQLKAILCRLADRLSEAEPLVGQISNQSDHSLQEHLARSRL